MPGNCDPPKEHQWKKGQSGNPKGRPPGPLITTRVKEFIEKHGLEGKVAEVWLGGAIDDPKLLETEEEYEYTDKRGRTTIRKRRYRRKPNAALLGMLLDRIEGILKLPDKETFDTNAMAAEALKVAKKRKRTRGSDKPSG